MGADLWSEEAEESEVIPLEHIADDTSRDSTLHRLRSMKLLSDHATGDDRRGDQGGGH